MTDQELLKSLRLVIQEEVKSIVQLEVKEVIKTEVRSIVREEIKTEILPLKRSFESLTMVVSSLTYKLNYLVNRVDSLASSIDSLVNRVSSLASSIDSLVNRVSSLETKVKSLERRQKRHGKMLGFVKLTVEIIGKSYDQRIVENYREIQRVKDHLGIPTKY